MHIRNFHSSSEHNIKGHQCLLDRHIFNYVMFCLGIADEIGAEIETEKEIVIVIMIEEIVETDREGK